MTHFDNALLTKQDLSQSEHGLRSEMKEMETRLKIQIIEVKTQLETRITEVEMRLEKQTIQLESRLITRLGAITVGSISIAVAILSTLHIFH